MVVLSYFLLFLNWLVIFSSIYLLSLMSHALLWGFAVGMMVMVGFYALGQAFSPPVRQDEPIHRFCRRRAGWIRPALPKQDFVDAVAVAPHCPHFRGRKHPPRLNKRLSSPLRVWNFFYKTRNKTDQISGLDKI